MSMGDSLSFPSGFSISASARAVGGMERTDTLTGGDTLSCNFYTAFVLYRR